MEVYCRTRNNPIDWNSQVLEIAVLGLLFVFLTNSDPAISEVSIHGMGIVVEEAGNLKSVGVQPGDVMVAWTRSPNPPANLEGFRGDIESVFNWLWMEIEQVPRGAMELIGERGGKRVVFEVPAGFWNVQVRPRLPPKILEYYLRGNELINSKDIAQGISFWQKALETQTRIEDRLLICWLHLKIGDAWEKGSEMENAQSEYRMALKHADDPFSQVVTLDALGKFSARNKYFKKAEENFRLSLEIRKSMWGESLSLAYSQYLLAGVARGRFLLNLAEEHFNNALIIYEKLAPESKALARIYRGLGHTTSDLGKLDIAKGYYSKSMGILENLHYYSVSEELTHLGGVAHVQGDFPLAEKHYKRALSIQTELDPEGGGAILSLISLGRVASLQGFHGLAEYYGQRALAIQEGENSKLFADSLSFLGEVALERGDFGQAESYFERAISHREEIAAGRMAISEDLRNLGIVARLRGRLNEAIEYTQQAISKLSKEGNRIYDSSAMAAALGDMAIIYSDLGDLQMAGEFRRESNNILEKIAPTNSGVAELLYYQLGLEVLQWGELDLAEDYFGRARNISETICPDSIHMAYNVYYLGIVHKGKGNLNNAERYLRQSLSIVNRISPGSLDVADSLNMIADVLIKKERYSEADEYLNKALLIEEKRAPKSLYSAETLQLLGHAARARRDLQQADSYYRQALVIREQLIPHSSALADNLKDLGLVARDRGALIESANYFNQSVNTLESQLGRLGSSNDLKIRFRARHGYYYRYYIEVLLEMNHFEEAFDVLERSRAQGFLEMLGERGLALAQDIPKKLNEERRRLAMLYDRTLRRMDGMPPERQSEMANELRRLYLDYDRLIKEIRDKKLNEERRRLAMLYDRTLRRMDGMPPERQSEMANELRRLYLDYDRLIKEIRESSPRFAELHYPQPIGLRKTQTILDPGTIMLSYSVGKKETDLFVVCSDKSFSVHNLAIGEGDLYDMVNDFRDLIDGGTPGSLLGPISRNGFERLGRILYKSLIEPAAESVRLSERIVIIPDGPLHLLPFNALIRMTENDSMPSLTSTDYSETDSTRGWQYLAEWKPLHSVLSATVYAVLRDSRRQDRNIDAVDESLQLTAFGDPAYPQNVTQDHRFSDVRIRSVVNRGLFDYAPLPHTRREVLQIADLYPLESTRTYFGEKATEERAKSIGSDTHILHFAVHGFFDDRSPLNSALVLSIPRGSEQRDNGLLQAWEIIESMRLDADLVVLSACDSGLGEALGPEGLIGLTRAFQYAGARTVAASLWQVEDLVTAQLMVRFYRHLRAGKPKDVALQAAQIELIRGPIEVRDENGQVQKIDASAPYYWAAFQMIGDWQ